VEEELGTWNFTSRGPTCGGGFCCRAGGGAFNGGGLRGAGVEEGEMLMICKKLQQRTGCID